MSLEKYNGVWDQFKASHLLRRTIFGPDKNQIDNAVVMGMEATIQELIRDTNLPPPPVNYYFNNDPNVAVGETWVQAPYLQISGLNTYRNRSLAKWHIELAREKNLSIKEKMVLFWHNHFVIGNTNDPRFLYQYVNTIRQNALGNFKELTKQITIDPSMLRYLNGNQNTRGNPNENYARELLELFTVGKGDNLGDGDYTTFTEVDVREMARALTGWRIFGFNSQTRPDFGSEYVRGRHDLTEKQLSHRFDNVVISNLEDKEYAHLIDIIFTKRACAEHLSRKLYRWFVHNNINDEIESEVIQPLADKLIESEFELKPVLAELLGSKVFYEADVIGCMIKHPLDFVLSAINPFEMLEGETNRNSDDINLGLFSATSALQMEIFNPPSVAGWKAFYQAPLFDKIWINSNTLPLRKTVVDLVTTLNDTFNRSPEVKIDVIKMVESTSDPLDVNKMLNEISVNLFSYALPEPTINTLKEILIPGLPDFEWTIEYLAFRQNPDDEDLKRIITTKLRLMFNYLLNLPEFQLI
jgi:uncharacterized protein (DUF1800 family)